MTAESSVRELLQQIADAYNDFNAATSGLTDDLLTKESTIGDWSVRDIIAHIGGDEMWMAGQLEALRFETMPTAASCYGIDVPPPPDMDWSQDGRNAWQRERLGGLSLEDTRGMAKEAHRRLLAVVAAFEDGDLSKPLAITELKTVGWIRPPQEGEEAYPLWQWIRGVTYHHYAEHAGAIHLVGATKGD